LLLNGRVLVAGGIDADELRRTELYDPASETWIATGAMTEPRYNHTATLLRDGRVLIAGGVGSASAELYDPTSGTWTATASMKSVRSGATATLLSDGTVLVVGGSISLSHGGAVASAELYDPATGKWTTTGKLSEARYGHTATLLPDGMVLVAGGVGDGEDNPTINTSHVSAERYDPGAGTWSATGPLAEGRAKHTATLLLDGSVLATRQGQLGSAELYDPESGSWATTGNMNTDRFVPTATLMLDGTVLVTGGYGQETEASAELYLPAEGAWTATAHMNAARSDHTATLLPDGRVLVAGGGEHDAVLSAELYDPGSGS
jgi:hypothetical protein